uniref:Ubiquitin thioesterase OTU n=1 Tax=Solanum lycopersicum TaxID=4081 RepID=A0A3Q7I0K2_SOLLC
MAAVFSNETVLDELRHGFAQFELVTSPVASVSASSYRPNQRGNPFFASSAATGHQFFARIGPSLGGASPALKKVERYSVQKITGDGRCMFRALVKGMAFNKGVKLHPRDERDDAGNIVHKLMKKSSFPFVKDELRMAVKEAICDDEKERLKYEEALVAITVEESLRRYCQRIGRSDFRGGESELLVLSKLCCQPIMVYIPEQEHGGRGSGFIPIAEYGAEFRKGSKNRKARKVVRLLYSGRNHYDLLL